MVTTPINGQWWPNYWAVEGAAQFKGKRVIEIFKKICCYPGRDRKSSQFFQRCQPSRFRRILLRANDPSTVLRQLNISYGRKKNTTKSLLVLCMCMCVVYCYLWLLGIGAIDNKQLCSLAPQPNIHPRTRLQYTMAAFMLGKYVSFMHIHYTNHSALYTPVAAPHIFSLIVAEEITSATSDQRAEHYCTEVRSALRLYIAD